MLKKIISLIFAVLFVFSAFSVTAFAKSNTVANVRDAMNLCRMDELFSIKKGTLYKDGKKVSKVYLIALTGSDMAWDKNDIKGMYTCIKSGMVIDNPYLDAVIEKAIKVIPKGSKIALIGHSLGGMIAQQFAADKEIKDRFEILNILTMGSPYIPVCCREGELHRMADSGDAVPYLSIAGIANFWAGNFTYKCNGYFGNPDKAHNISYNTSDKWLEYDCFGVKGGTAKIVY